MKYKIANIDKYIFDMDGTLYQLDGINNGFKCSSLEKNVDKNAIEFIIKNERVDFEKAKKIFDQGLVNSTGLSLFISKRYRIKRSDYFNNVWDIDPENIVKNFDKSVESIRELTRRNIKLILITSAPKIWQEKVIKFLELTNIFESIYTGENFESKEEIFKQLSEKFIPSSMVSIGDQKQTDILPAQKFGIKGFLIKNPNEISNLI